MKKILWLVLALSAFVSCARVYKIDVDGDAIVVTSPDGIAQHYKPEFIVLRTDANPNKQLRRGDFGYELKEDETQGLDYKIPTWGVKDSFVADPSLHVEDGYNPEIDRAISEGRTANYFMAAPSVVVRAVSLRKEAGSIVMEFPENEQFTISATISTGPYENGLPCVHMEFAPKCKGWYSIGFAGASEVAPDSVDELWQAQIWSEKRFPNLPYLTESFRSSIPTALMTVDGVTSGVIADPRYVPYTNTPPTSRDSQFGVLLRNAAGNAQPMLFAPVLGNQDSKMADGDVFAFDFYLYHKKSGLMDSFEDIAYNICDFRDMRENSTCNLNTTIENTIEYVLSPYAMFIDSLRGCNYSTDVPGAVKNISGLHPLEFAILTDNEHIFQRLSRPMLEFGLSRERFLFSTNDKVKGQGTSSRLNGPGVPVTDLLTAYIYSGSRSDYFLEDGKRLYDNKAVRSLNLDFKSYEDRWLNSLVLYHCTGDQQYLDQAVADADKYLEERVYTKQVDYSDKYSLGWFFWTSFTNQWMELLWMYELTGYQRYLDAAHEGARYYCQYCWVTPVVPDGTIRVNEGGVVPKYRNDSTKYVYMNMPEADVEAWKLSEIGLTPESSGTCAGHRAIFMAHHAPFMMRIAALTGDKFLHDMARNAVVGRYEAFPGYHLNAGRTNAFERKDFAFRSQKELNGHTSIHYNHPQSQVAMLWDYLFSDVYYASEKKIDFPVEYSEGYAYCRSFIYGAHPGTFYEDDNVYAYMPAGLVESSDIQANYLAGYGNGKLYLALVNQSKDDIETTITFDPEKSSMDPSCQYTATVWKQNRRAGKITVSGNQVTLKIKGEGITAIAVEGVDVQTEFQHKMLSDRPKWAVNHTSVGFENDRAVILDFGENLRSVYVWNESNNEKFKKTVLHYAIDGEWKEIEKTWYPYEYTIPLAESDSTFEYYFEAFGTNGGEVVSEIGKLNK